MAKATSWTPRKRGQFLSALRKTGNVTAAAEAAGLSRSQAYQLRRSDDGFRQDWDDALQAAIDDLEEELRRRALHGVEQPIYYGGKECGRVRTYNDALGMFLLRARRRELFDKAGGDELATAIDASPLAEIQERLKRLRARQAKGRKSDGDKP